MRVMGNVISFLNFLMGNIINCFNFSSEKVSNDADEEDVSGPLVLYIKELENELKGIEKFDYSKFKTQIYVGHGGSAVVYSAVFEEKKYALKSLNNNLSIDKKRFRMIKRELGLHYKLDHPNIVKFHGISIGM
ncbi:hypothetical protein C2G38_1184925 [Gigaspora rosea]|uniref:Protein kinase domain-containing protein n=1 Tax=Gigaspora rosea TaxID=44941 RepID=A0A397VHX4_9GLOM|nr:hypothetical protein C2G38_1184925 [Gigaspora rosea]